MKRCLLFLPFLFLLVSCATSPITGKKELRLIGDSAEISIGASTDEQVKAQYGVYEDPKLQEYVANIGKGLVAVSHRKNIPYHFTILDTPIVNAFAAPGGYIYVTRGLLVRVNSEAELAGVIGHEIGHVTARHGVKQLQKQLGFAVLLQAGTLLLKKKTELTPDQIGLTQKVANAAFALTVLGYSRENEYQADELGTSYEYKAGHNPEGLLGFLGTLKRMGGKEPDQIEILLSSHPPTSERIEGIKDQIKGWDMTGKALRSNHYKGMIDGLPLGRGGTIKGNTYKSRPGRCAVSAPLEWEIKEPDQGPLCLLQSKDLSVQLSFLKTKEPLTTENFAKAIEEQNSQLKKTEEGEIKAANISGQVATYLSQEENKGYRIGYFVKDDLAYLLVGLAPLDKIDAAQSDIDRIIKSFCILSREELALLPENRLKVYTVQEGDTLSKIAREFSLEPLEIARFNGLAEDAQLKAGDKLKVPPN